MSENEPGDLRLILECSVYHPKGTEMFAATIAGPIWRIPVGAEQVPPDDIHHPLVRKISVSRHHRRQLEYKLNWNSRLGRQEIGKPNSAFVVQFADHLVVDHLQESNEFERPGSPKLHNLMALAVDYYPASFIMSGHIAPLVVPVNRYKYVMSLDPFEGEKAYTSMGKFQREVIYRLSGTGIIPLTADAFPIRPYP